MARLQNNPLKTFDNGKESTMKEIINTGITKEEKKEINSEVNKLKEQAKAQGVEFNEEVKKLQLEAEAFKRKVDALIQKPGPKASSRKIAFAMKLEPETVERFKNWVWTSRMKTQDAGEKMINSFLDTQLIMDRNTGEVLNDPNKKDKPEGKKQ
jgi:phenylalanyl-tRNA synthetase alpha subunit